MPIFPPSFFREVFERLERTQKHPARVLLIFALPGAQLLCSSQQMNPFDVVEEE